MELKMSNVDAVQERESTFRFERLAKNFSMTFDKAVTNQESETADEITALMYKINGGGNVIQRFNIYSFRRNVKFVEDNAENNKTLKSINKLIEQLIAKHGESLTFSQLAPVYDLIDGLDYINPFQPVDGKEGYVNIPDELEVKAIHPKLNVGLFDAPSNATKLRYTTRSYKANSYIRNEGGQFEVSKEGESLSYTSRELGKEGLYDDIIDLYDVAAIDPSAAIDPRNVIFNSAICVVH